MVFVFLGCLANDIDDGRGRICSPSLSQSVKSNRPALLPFPVIDKCLLAAAGLSQQGEAYPEMGEGLCHENPGKLAITGERGELDNS